jgi:transposase
MDINDGRKLTPSAQDAVRRKAVQAVVSGRMTQTATAELFGVTRTSVCLWVKAFRQGGEAALQSKRKGRPSGGKLSKTQAESIRKSVLGKNPGQLRLPGFLWTRDLVSELIERRFGVSLSRWTVGRYLNQWGLSVQRPAKRALEQNPAQVAYWLQHKYPAIQRQATKEKGKIWWVDEAGLRSTHQTGTTWGKKGTTPLVKMSGERFGCNAITAITNQGNLSFSVFEGRFTVDVFQNFLERLVQQQAGQKIFLIVDRHSVHKSGRITKWLSARKDAIEMFFLPAYSPELNPDELLNQDVKRNLFRKGRAKTKPELMGKLRGFFRSKQRRPEKVKNYFNGKYVAYAKAA